jgi:hypothetical protein
MDNFRTLSYVVLPYFKIKCSRVRHVFTVDSGKLLRHNVQTNFRNSVKWLSVKWETHIAAFLGAFAKLEKKVTVGFVIAVCLSVCLSVRPHGATGLPLEGFSWNLIFEYFSKICLENSSFVNIRHGLRVLYINTYVRLTLYLLTWNIWWAPNNASKWQMRFNWAFKGLK